MEMRGKVAVVTGGAQGIGEAVVRRLAAAGAVAVIADYRLEAAEACASRAASLSGAAVEVRHVDVADSASVRELMQGIHQAHGRLDILVNNAGVQLNKASLELTDEEWDRMIAVNLDGPFRCAREAGRFMAAQGGGAIVSISSVAEKFGLPRRLPYCVAKAGVSSMTRVLAAEWAELGIRVNAVAPGYVWTDLNRHAMKQGYIRQEDIEGQIPQRRLAEPAEIAEAVLYLCSEAAGYVTGQTLFVDGGYSAAK